MEKRKRILDWFIEAIQIFLQWLLTKPLKWLAGKFASAPKKDRVIKSLSELYDEVTSNPGKKGMLYTFNPAIQPVIIFSDEHKGARNGSDIFAASEKNYSAALEYYNNHQFFFINLGDCEELWQNTIFRLLRKNKKVFEVEKLFVRRKAYYKIFGNHDLFWDNTPLSQVFLKRMYGEVIRVFACVVMRMQLSTTDHIDIFCTHGHQGDSQADGNAFAKWVVSYVWGPISAFLHINPNTPSTNDNRKTLHNMYMYEWSKEQENVILITGHTHQPVFNSVTHLEHLYLLLEEAHRANDAEEIARIEAEIPRRKREYDFVNNSFRNMKPSYFNSGCCCFDDGTITGIEIANGFIRLVKWKKGPEGPVRVVAEEVELDELAVRFETYKEAEDAAKMVT
ncbi:MAG: metallophosphoesterase [Bacteroidetes bacterium]|nr:MAG: metallophosphoesterase [Bacteroidota bacterium]